MCLKFVPNIAKLPKVATKVVNPGGETSQVHLPISYSQLGNLTQLKLVQTLEGLFISQYSVDPRLSCNLKKLVKLESLGPTTTINKVLLPQKE